MGCKNNKSKEIIVDNNFLNVHFSITIAYKVFKFCLHSLHIHSEGTVSQIFDIGLTFYFLSKKRKTFSKMCKHHF